VTTLQFEYGSSTLQDFTYLHEKNQLNLNPGFQRDSVWNLSDRKKLIESLLQGYPVPSVFLYRQSTDGKLSYDVIDGKQRLETVLRFQGARTFGRERFSLKWKFDVSADYEEWDWSKLQRKHLGHNLSGYKFQTVEVRGDLSDIIDLFVRINSTGKRLTGAEKRHARYFHSEFLKKAAALAERKRRFFLENRLLSPGQISRMKHVELTCELMVSIQSKGLIDKKKALDSVIGGKAISAPAVNKAVSEVVRVLGLVKRMFPNFGVTRFRNAADFYSLFMLIWKMDSEGMILNNARRNQLASAILAKLDVGVATVREQQRKAKGANESQRIFADYLLAVQSDTDSLAQRQRREEILKRLLSGLFERRDSQRVFNADQRRILWHSDDRKRCSHCKKPLDWTNFTVDHTRAHAVGGRTSLENASLMCKPCNSRFGKNSKTRMAKR